MIISVQKAKNLMYKLIPSKDVNVKKMMQSDWPRGRTGHPKTKVIVSVLPFLHDYLHGKYLRYGLIFFGDIDDQRILQLDWSKVKTGHTKPKVVISDATFA